MTVCLYVQFSNKDALLQDFILHDTLLRNKSALEQFAAGLQSVGILRLIRLFPQKFEDIFTHKGDAEVSASSVIDIFGFSECPNEESYAPVKRVMEMLNKFIMESSPDGKFTSTYLNSCPRPVYRYVQ